MLNGVVLGLLMKPVPTKTIIEPPDVFTSAAQTPTGKISIIFIEFLGLIYIQRL